MKYMVGLQNRRDDLLESIIENKDHIYEVYFSWGDIPNGRNTLYKFSDKTLFEMQNSLVSDLTEISKARIPLNLLLNANCYGEDSLSVIFIIKSAT